MNNDGAAKAFGIKEGEGEARWWAGGLVTTKVTGKETGGLYSIVEVLEPQGAAAPLHVHHNEDEAFYILEGEVTFYVGESSVHRRGSRSAPSGRERLGFLQAPTFFSCLYSPICREGVLSESHTPDQR